MRLISMAALVLVLGRPLLAHAEEYSAWQPSDEYDGFVYRARFDRSNESFIKQGKSGHSWCIEVRNDNQGRAKLRIAISDAAGERPAEGKWTTADLAPGASKDSCMNFIGTPPGGSTRVWFDKVSIDGKDVPPPCDPGVVTVAAVISKAGEIKVIKITRGAEVVTLSRASLVALSKLRKSPPLPGDGVTYRDALLHLGGAGAPTVTMSTLAQQFCGTPEPPSLRVAAKEKVRQKLQSMLEEATRLLCERDKSPAKCAEKVRKKTYVNEGTR